MTLAYDDRRRPGRRAGGVAGSSISARIGDIDGKEEFDYAAAPYASAGQAACARWPAIYAFMITRPPGAPWPLTHDSLAVVLAHSAGVVIFRHFQRSAPAASVAEMVIWPEGDERPR